MVFMEMMESLGQAKNVIENWVIKIILSKSGSHVGRAVA